MAASDVAFERYLADYTGARSDALKAIDVVARCANTGTSSRCFSDNMHGA